MAVKHRNKLYLPKNIKTQSVHVFSSLCVRRYDKININIKDTIKKKYIKSLIYKRKKKHKSIISYIELFIRKKN